MSNGLLKALGLFLFLSLALAQLYEFCNQYLQLSSFAAVLVNTFIVGTVAFLQRGIKVGSNIIAAQSTSKMGFLNVTWFPGLAVLCGAFAIAFLSSHLLNGIDSSSGTDALGWTYQQVLLTVLWVPIVEEILFRNYLTQVFSRLCGVGWGAYISVCLFSYIHSWPTLTRLIEGKTAMMLGPLCLGAMTQFLVYRTGRLYPAILLHAACNATVYIFATWDQRWLEWLSEFYL